MANRLLIAAAIATSTVSSASAEPSRSKKNPELARWLAIGATTIGYVGMAVTLPSLGDYDGSRANDVAFAASATMGLLVGPSTGHLYVGEYGHAIKAGLLRLGGTAALVYGASLVIRRSGHCDLRCDTGGGWLLAGIGAGALVGSTIYDIVDSRRAARRHNAPPQAVLVPTVSNSMIGGALAGTF